MKAIILKEDLDKVLPVVSRVAVNRGQLPVLSNVLISAEKSSITFSATNLELGVTLTVGGKVLEEGSITIPAKNMAEFVSLARSNEIILETKEDKLKANAGKTTVMFAGISAAEFPVMPKLSNNDRNQNKLVLERKKIALVAEKVGYAASLDEARLVLTGIKFYKSEGNFRVVATDGFRLARLDLGVIGKSEKDTWPDGLIIPSKAIVELAKILVDKDKDKVEMEVVKENNQVVFWMSGVMLVSRVLDGNFPDVDKIIPTEFKTTAILDKKEIFEAVRTAAIFARENSNIVKFKIEENKCRVSAVGQQTGEGESWLDGESRGDEVEIAFNYKYVLDLLNSIDNDKVAIMANGSQTAVVFGGEGEKDLVAIVMPVRI